jgi:hypothetical protein
MRIRGEMKATLLEAMELISRMLDMLPLSMYRRRRRCVQHRFASPRLASPFLASSRLASPRLVTPCLVTPCLASPLLRGLTLGPTRTA